MTFGHSTQTIHKFIKTALAVPKILCYIVYSFPISHGGEPTALAGKATLQAFVPTFVGVALPKPFRPVCCCFPKALGYFSFQPNKASLSYS